MKRELVQRWIEALRSRRYKQGISYLRKKDDKGVDRYCCLGVLCDLTNSNNWQINDYDNIYSYEYKGCKNEERLCGCMAYDLDLDADLENHLIKMNDSKRKFYEIARYLERKFLRNEEEAKNESN